MYFQREGARTLEFFLDGDIGHARAFAVLHLERERVVHHREEDGVLLTLAGQNRLRPRHRLGFDPGAERHYVHVGVLEGGAVDFEMLCFVDLRAHGAVVVAVDEVQLGVFQALVFSAVKIDRHEMIVCSGRIEHDPFLRGLDHCGEPPVLGNVVGQLNVVTFKGVLLGVVGALVQPQILRREGVIDARDGVERRQRPQFGLVDVLHVHRGHRHVVPVGEFAEEVLVLHEGALNVVALVAALIEAVSPVSP